MKTFWITVMKVIFLFLCISGIKAQTTQTEFNQVELYKQFIGLWKLDYSSDSTFLWETKSIGKGFEVYMKWESKGKIKWEAHSLVGYDKKNDILIEAMIDNKSPNIELWSIRFLLPDKSEEILLDEISHPDRTTEKDIFEFLSPDIFVDTYLKNNKVVKIDTLKRVK